MVSWNQRMLDKGYKEQTQGSLKPLHLLHQPTEMASMPKSMITVDVHDNV